MSYSQWRVDRYRMNFRFKTMLDSQYECTGTAPGKDITFGTGRHEVTVRVTNRLQTPLAPEHLQSVALSVPGLYARSLQFPAGKGLYHCGQLHIYRLPTEASEGDFRDLSDSLSLLPSLIDGEAVRKSLELQGWSGIPSANSDAHSQISDADEFFTCSSPDPASPETANSDGFNSACGDLQSLSHELPCKGVDEQVSVEFRGQRYLRLLSPVKGKEGDVEASWMVTDFTEAGKELVLSLCLDFIRPQPLVAHWIKDTIRGTT